MGKHDNTGDRHRPDRPIPPERDDEDLPAARPPRRVAGAGTDHPRRPVLVGVDLLPPQADRRGGRPAHDSVTAGGHAINLYWSLAATQPLLAGLRVHGSRMVAVPSRWP